MTRHELKEQLQHDQFTDAASRTFEYIAENREKVTRWALVVAAIAASVGGWFWYASYRKSVRQQDLQAAFAVLDAQVGPANQFAKSFPTQEAKTQASMKALQSVVAKDAGTKEGYIAQYYLGTLKAQNGDSRGAEADLKAVADSGTDSAALAKIALAQVYAGGGKTSQAQELLKSLVNKPTDLVSKAQAEIMLARLDRSISPQQAKVILQGLKTNQDPVVSRAVNELSAQLAQ
ncbi:MAG: tetratricopeptide repeat protein [Acidobacteriaceae bacterium]|nr:tetratricopeptide repeat protein [Acidobacteriaceae bacterium]MBV9500914.1 tetratricopeptide repeat protein [Acidobacteriaceae bacterium]